MSEEPLGARAQRAGVEDRRQRPRSPSPESSGRRLPDRDEFVALGLLDAAAADVDDREALLRFLLTRGGSIDDLRRSRDLGQLVGESFDRTVRPGPRLSRREVGWRTGLDDDVLVRLRQATGLPDPGPDLPHYTEADVLAARAFERLALLFGEGVALQLMRVTGAALANIAESAVSAYMVSLAAPLRAIGISGSDAAADDLATARGFAEVVAALPDLARSLDTQLRHHIETALHQFAFTHRGELSPDAVPVDIGIVELVAPTSWARAKETAELSTALASFIEIANDAISAHGGRFVKLVGDGVMFAVSQPSGDHAVACEIALDVVEHCATDRGFPPVRAAIARGGVVVLDGDYHGAAVNLATRMLDAADSHQILTTASVTRTSGPGYRSCAFGAHTLRGFDEPVELFTVTRSIEARDIA
jgi:adenylate cyclase